ncbi:hypothetical protein [Allostella humosa]|uniref:hypothetical protein n=1 Tax=Stella humosa TaxID=94 RepID=UPI0014770839|nr:hypothetical protein [Stella humosa]
MIDRPSDAAQECKPMHDVAAARAAVEALMVLRAKIAQSGYIFSIDEIVLMRDEGRRY